MPTFSEVETTLWVWLVVMIRPGAAFIAAPVFSAPSVPVQLRLIIALGVGLPTLMVSPITLPPGGLVTIEGFLLILGEVLVGLALGFAVQIGFAAALIAGETISNAMGLGFAGMVDPNSGASTPALGEFLSILGTFLFLAIGGHLMLATIIFDSYRTLPPGAAWMSEDAIRSLFMFGGDLFAAGLAIALPVGFAIILVQLLMAMLARSAPALNLFSVGLPAALLSGLVLLAIAAPSISDAMTRSIVQGLNLSRKLALGH